MKHNALSSIRQLANYLNTTEEFIQRAIQKEYAINEPFLNKLDTNLSLMKESDFDFNEFNVEMGNPMEVNKFYLKKKSKRGGLRTVYSPSPLGLASILKILNNKLTEIYQPPECVHGFIKGRSIRTNAKEHLGKKYVLSIDIKDFFDVISSERVMRCLIKLGFSADVANWICKITTVDGHLVQGFHSSPTIANIVAQEMDKEFVGVSGFDITYTRYADDLYFSSNSKLPDISIFEGILNKFSFQINEHKTVLMKRGKSQYVTGLTVFDDKIPRIPKRIKRNIRLEVYYICKNGYRKHAIKQLQKIGIYVTDNSFRSELDAQIIEIQNRLFGWLHYINGIEPKFASNEIRKLCLSKRHINFKIQK